MRINKIVPVFLTIIALSLIISTVYAEQSNRNEVRAELKKGGWLVKYGDENNEAYYQDFRDDVARAVDCQCSQPLDSWFDYRLDDYIDELQLKAPGTSDAHLLQLIIRSLDYSVQKNSAQKMRVGNIELSAGSAWYARWDLVPKYITRKYVCGKTMSGGEKYCTRTESYTIPQDIPDKFQAYVRYRLVGEPASTRLPATEQPRDVCTNNYQFVTDVTIPDGTKMRPGQNFIKTWRYRNTGTCPWDENYRVKHYSGPLMGSPTSFKLPKIVGQNEIVDISVSLEAPLEPGNYKSRWQLLTPDGKAFPIASRPFLEIVVED